MKYGKFLSILIKSVRTPQGWWGHSVRFGAGLGNQSQSDPQTRTAQLGAMGAAPAPGIPHLLGERDRPRTGWDMCLWVGPAQWGLWGAGDWPCYGVAVPRELTWGPGPWQGVSGSQAGTVNAYRVLGPGLNAWLDILRNKSIFMSFFSNFKITIA